MQTSHTCPPTHTHQATTAREFGSWDYQDEGEGAPQYAPAMGAGAGQPSMGLPGQW